MWTKNNHENTEFTNLQPLLKTCATSTENWADQAQDGSNPTPSTLCSAECRSPEAMACPGPLGQQLLIRRPLIRCVTLLSNAFEVQITTVSKWWRHNDSGKTTWQSLNVCQWRFQAQCTVILSRRLPSSHLYRFLQHLTGPGSGQGSLGGIGSVGSLDTQQGLNCFQGNSLWGLDVHGGPVRPVYDHNPV